MEGTDIKALRRSRSMTQQELADHIGVTRKTILQWESNGLPKHGPARAAIEQWAREEISE